MRSKKSCLLLFSCFLGSVNSFAHCPAESFSSYSKGLHLVKAMESKKDRIEFQLELPKSLEEALRKANSISLDGVCATFSLTESAEHIKVIATLEKTDFDKSALPLAMNEAVNIGFPSQNSGDWLLKTVPFAVVTLAKVELAPGHDHTEQLTFEASREQYEAIKKVRYIGLNGSGFFVQSIEVKDDKYYFLVHAGKETRKETIFSIGKILVGKRCTLSLPFSKDNTP